MIYYGRVRDGKTEIDDDQPDISDSAMAET
jgi:hypothetical protein